MHYKILRDQKSSPLSQGSSTPSTGVERKETLRWSIEATATPTRSQNPSAECVTFRTARSLSEYRLPNFPTVD